jgi:hypothetical protein
VGSDEFNPPCCRSRVEPGNGLTRAPDGVKRIALLLFATFLLLLLLWSIWHLMIWVCRGIFYFVERGNKLNFTVDSFRIVVPQVLKTPLLICLFALFLAAVGHFSYDFYVLLRVAVFATCAVEFLSFRAQFETSGWVLRGGRSWPPSTCGYGEANCALAQRADTSRARYSSIDALHGWTQGTGRSRVGGG